MTVVDSPPTAVDPAPAQEARDPTRVQALFEEARRLRRRKRRRRSAVVVVVIALLTGLGIAVRPFASNPGSTSNLGGPGTPVTGTPVPRQMVVWRSFQIQVISSTTGETVRTLAKDITLFRGTPTISVAPDRTVYFDRGVEPTPGRPTEQIWSVPLTGGVPTVVVRAGWEPTISPDGRYLAYQRYTDMANGPATVAIQDLLTGTTVFRSFSSMSSSIDSLSWSPDSSVVAVTATTSSADHQSGILTTSLIGVDTPPVPIETSPRVHLPRCPPGPWAQTGVPNQAGWIGYLSASEGLTVCPRVGLSAELSTLHFDIIDVSTGRIVGHLPTLHGQLSTGNDAVGANGAVQLDTSRQHLAVVLMGTGNGLLKRWAVGSRPSQTRSRPVRVAAGVTSTAWVPTRP